MSPRKKWERQRPTPLKPQPQGLQVTVAINASMQQIAALGPERTAAFMEGVARIVSAHHLYSGKPR